MENKLDKRIQELEFQIKVIEEINKIGRLYKSNEELAKLNEKGIYND